MKKLNTAIKVGLFADINNYSYYLQILNSNASIEVVGVYFPKEKPSQKSALRVPIFSDVVALMHAAAAVVIVSTHVDSYDWINQAIRFAKPILTGRSMITNTRQAKEICSLVEEAVLPYYIYSPYRVYPAFKSFSEKQLSPDFIEINQQLTYSDSVNFNLIYDCLIDHIDFILWATKSPLHDIVARGYKLRGTDLYDVLNIQLSFFNRSSASIILSRLAEKPAHHIHLYGAGERKSFDMYKPAYTSTAHQSIQNTVTEFIESLQRNEKSSLLATEYDGLKYLEIVDVIASQIDNYAYFHKR